MKLTNSPFFMFLMFLFHISFFNILGVFILSYSMRDIGTAIFLWSLEGPNPDERKFKKRYFTFWNNYNILMDAFFMIGIHADVNIKNIFFIKLGSFNPMNTTVMTFQIQPESREAFNPHLIKIK